MLFSLLLTLVSAGGASVAQADQTAVFGVDRFGQALYLPQSVCAYPGQEIRVLADGIDRFGRRMGLRAESFAWRLNRGNGAWDQWSPAYSPAYGPFRRAPEFVNAVYVRVPYDVGAGRLDTQGNGLAMTSFRVVDANLRQYYPCDWAHPDVYQGGGGPGPVPEPPQGPVPPPPNNPPNNPPQQPPNFSPCFNQCSVGAVCTDGCPSRGQCNYVPADRPYWRVLRCFR